MVSEGGSVARDVCTGTSLTAASCTGAAAGSGARSKLIVPSSIGVMLCCRSISAFQRSAARRAAVSSHLSNSRTR
eukprot:781157-Prymnesium_polylepis.1